MQILRDECQKPGIKQWLGLNTSVRVMKAPAARAWKDLVKTTRVTYQGGMLVDADSNHMFFSMLYRGTPTQCPCMCKFKFAAEHAVNPGADLPAVLQQSVQRGSNRAATSGSDVVTLIKEYISSEELSQHPLLTLSADRGIAGDLLPRDKQELRDKASAKIEWRKTAEKVLQVYGEKYRRSYTYLMNLCNDTYHHGARLPPLPWLRSIGTPPDINEPEFCLHGSVLDALAPKAQLRAVWRRQ